MRIIARVLKVKPPSRTAKPYKPTVVLGLDDNPQAVEGPAVGKENE